MSRTSAVLLRSQSDERLVALTRAGHERAFETLVRRYRRPLLSACRRIVDDGRAEDVLQQALLAAWRALRRGDEVHDARAWLFRIVRNAAISHRRRAGQAGAELVETLSVAASPEEEAERREVVQETLATIAGLPPRQREALLRIAVQGASQDEVAEELGVSRVAVRQLVHRARSSLRAAATALAPLPLITWAAGAGSGDSMSVRIAGLVTGAGGAGAAATFAKAGAVAGVAATAVSAPALVSRHPQPEPTAASVTRDPQPEPTTAPATRTPRPAKPTPAPTETPVLVARTPAPQAPAAPRRRATPTPTPTVRPRRIAEPEHEQRDERDHDDGERPKPSPAPASTGDEGETRLQVDEGEHEDARRSQSSPDETDDGDQPEAEHDDDGAEAAARQPGETD